MSKRKHKKVRRRPLVSIAIVIVMIVAGFVLYSMYDRVYGPNIYVSEKKNTHIYIPTGSDMADVVDILDTTLAIEDLEEFEWLADKKNYHNNIHPGRYLIENRMSNNALINLLRSGRQDPVNLIFNNVRTKSDLAQIISGQIEADPSAILRLLHDEQYLESFGFTPQTVYAMFLPNTYEFWWNTSAKELMQRMHKEYQSFWNEQRRNKAKQMGLSPVKVTTLASIVDEETMKDEEMPTIAGVYINRLEKGMRLQADPTVKFAAGDFTVKRVLNKHLEIDSPYNTYKYRGLPPGPIAFPSIAAIKSVLNYQKHDYLYFVAKPDFSGYHRFSKTHYQHIINAREYREALNQRNIME